MPRIDMNHFRFCQSICTVSS